MRRIFIQITFLVLLSLSPVEILAQTNVVVSEVFPAPDTGGNEWVEIYNQASSSAYLSNWTLSDTLSSPSILHQFVDFVLGPYEVFVLNLSGSKLNNTGDTVVLSDPSATYSATLTYPNATKGLSWHLNLTTNEVYEATPSAGVVATVSAVVAPTPTPSPTVTPIPTPTATPATILTKPEVSLSEIMACPISGQPEWIKLFNSGEALEIINWVATDSTGNTRRFSGVLPKDNYTIFSWTSSMLNNTGDSIKITTDSGIVVDQASYSECVSGKSLSLLGEVWQPPQPTPTPGVASVLSTLNTTATPAETGEVLGSTTRQTPYPYSLREFAISHTASSAGLPTKQYTRITTPPKQIPSSSSGILGGLLLIISSLYARGKSFI
ncbi:MAG: lamin tail domain-containing protein [Candidatus Pacebacteria bacterium]|nr:lamin tail domain-containing protein [Candidatus Paceibacterota bacterium]PIR59570.1 MAG: hypothetical protein COU68_04835 [Candidatus Pacebacteria bacterium CG10_big_fil_rev_8_21_14_0_10_45_6]